MKDFVSSPFVLWFMSLFVFGACIFVSLLLYVDGVVLLFLGVLGIW